jgi:hypothetical protein
LWWCFLCIGFLAIGGLCWKQLTVLFEDTVVAGEAKPTLTLAKTIRSKKINFFIVSNFDDECQSYSLYAIFFAGLYQMHSDECFLESAGVNLLICCWIQLSRVMEIITIILKKFICHENFFEKN